MKVALIFICLAIGGGIGVGRMLSSADYVQPQNVLGPISLERTGEQSPLDEVVQAKRQMGAPKAEVVGGTEFDFGVMLRNATGKHKFTIKNVGTAELVVEVVGSTCKCTVGTLEKGVLAPGETTEVQLEWTAKTESRNFGQSATLKTNDPQQHEIALQVQGEVVELVAAEPISWNLGDVASSAPIELKTSLYNYADQEVIIKDIRWLGDLIQERSTIDYQRRDIDPAKDGSHAGAKEAYDVSIVVQPGLAQGPLSQTLRVDYETAEHDDHPPLEVVLTGRVVGAISLMGSSKLQSTEQGVYTLKLGSAKVGEVIEEKVHVLFRGPLREEAKLKVGAIEPENALEAEFGEPTKRGSMAVYPLFVRTKADAPEMELAGKSEREFGIITVESDRPEVAPLRIGVVFRVGQPFGS